MVPGFFMKCLDTDNIFYIKNRLFFRLFRAPFQNEFSKCSDAVWKKCGKDFSRGTFRPRFSRLRIALDFASRITIIIEHSPEGGYCLT
jgi:hypothetical protein